MKYCKDCAYYRKATRYKSAMCTHPKGELEDGVYGPIIRPCEEVRLLGPCGQKASLFTETK